MTTQIVYDGNRIHLRNQRSAWTGGLEFTPDEWILLVCQAKVGELDISRLPTTGSRVEMGRE